MLHQGDILVQFILEIAILNFKATGASVFQNGLKCLFAALINVIGLIDLDWYSMILSNIHRSSV